MKQSMIFAAGMGTRLKPLTDSMPKAMVPVAGKPLLWHIVMKLKRSGFERIVINVHHFADQIVDYVKDNDGFGLDILISDECNKLLDTGGGLRKALPLFDDKSPVLIHNVDIFSNVDLGAFYDKASSADALLLVYNHRSGRDLLFDTDMNLSGWTNDEKGIVRCISGKEPSELKRFAFSGIHIVHPYLLESMQQMPEKFGIFEYYMKYSQQYKFLGFEHHDLRMLDVGKLDTLEQAEAFLRTSDRELEKESVVSDSI